ncbi:MAG: PrsW family intramembrane metalloprotease [Actinomycetales bacterium]|nr:PrsW family intramembrane metalloprotease [Actinomycetales bacterium]HMT31442.1 PrsW family intramembrane metalloprotease [Dermatophilaceae bacterium]
MAPPAWSAAPVPTRRSVAGRRVLTGVIIAGFLLASAGLLWIFNVDLGWRTAAFMAAVSAVPLLIVVPLYRWVDQLEAEPARYLWFAFLWGALCAPLGALLLNTTFHTLLMMSGVSNPDSAAAVLSAPPVEEGLKGLGVLLILLVRRREFDGVIDGIVYAGMAGAGFALTENILYLGHAYSEYGNQGLGATFILRCLMAPFAHPLFTACIGIGLGLAASVARTVWGKLGYGLLGYACAMLLHAVWNLSATLDAYFEVYLLVQVPLFIGFLTLLFLLKRREGDTIRRQLTAYADHGWFTYPEVAMLSSVPTRRQARHWAHAWIGPRGEAAMEAFQREASDLALLRQRMTRRAAEADAVERERELLTSIAAHRADLLAAAHTPTLGR